MARINSTKFIHVSQDKLTEIEKSKTSKRCRICGKSIWYDNTKVQFNIDGKVLCGTLGTTYKTKKVIYGITYNISMCQYCLEKKYPDFITKNKSRIFNTLNKYVAYAFDIPDEVINQRNKECVPTLENFKKKYGEVHGQQKFDEYRRKQAITNTFEYKQQKYGWTEEQFDEFNKSRAVTYENLVKRYGPDIGKEKWDAYVNKQSITSTNEYLVKKFGEEYVKIINLCKGHSLEGFVAMHGEVLGKEKYDNCNKLYSDKSKMFFDELVENLIQNDIYYTFLYADNEYMIKGDNGYYFLDFYIPEINLAIEFYGDYWHCNPSRFSAEDIHPNYRITAKEIWRLNEERKQDITNKLNCEFIILWENDIVKYKEFVISEIIKQIKNKELCIKK